MPNVELRINGLRRRVDVEPERSLLDVLRDELDLTGTKYGCGEGQCGACTVLLDGRATRSCLTRVSAVGDRAITTIEGLEQDGRLHPVQEAFLEAGAFQCGYCTPGMILEAVALLHRDPDPGELKVSRTLESHICRCGVHPRIVNAVRAAAGKGRRR